MFVFFLSLSSSFIGVLREIFEIDIFTGNVLVDSEHGFSLSFEMAGWIEGVGDENLILDSIGGSHVRVRNLRKNNIKQKYSEIFVKILIGINLFGENLFYRDEFFPD